MEFTLRMDCDNAAFDGNMEDEIIRILESLQTDIRDTCLTGYDKYQNLRDINGNIVGAWRLK